VPFRTFRPPGVPAQFTARRSCPIYCPAFLPNLLPNLLPGVPAQFTAQFTARRSCPIYCPAFLPNLLPGVPTQFILLRDEPCQNLKSNSETFARKRYNLCPMLIPQLRNKKRKTNFELKILLIFYKLNNKFGTVDPEKEYCPARIYQRNSWQVVRACASSKSRPKVRTNFLRKVETRIAFLRAIRSLARILRRHKLTTCQVFSSSFSW
jgi:hypothetical protein